ncbi:MAG: TldD/PmbA family protein [Candidatus Diapherotrites archaeon]|nr:TldD/PmbA family protein [Candidatus Diapherotrites archaeon]
MMETSALLNAVDRSLIEFRKNSAIREAEVFASANRLNVYRLGYASNIPSNGLEESKSEESFGMSVRVLFSDGRLGFGKTDGEVSLKGALEAFEKAKRSAVPDPDFKSFPSPAGKPKLKNYADKQLVDLDEAVAVDMAYSALNGAFSELRSQKMESSVNLTGEVSFLVERMAVANSNGISETDESTIAVSRMTAILEGSQDVSGMWFDSSTSLTHFNPFHAGTVSVQKAFSLLNGTRVESGPVDAVIGPVAFADILYSRLALSLDAVEINASPFCGMLDKPVASEKFSIADNALLEGAIGSKRVTDEGLPTGITPLIEKGKLVNFLSNDYYAKKFLPDRRFSGRNGFRFGDGDGRNYDSEPGVYASNLVVEPGSFGEEELVSEIRNGIYVGRIWYTYPVNGLSSPDFTSTIRGDSFIIRNGKIAEPLVPNTLRINDSFLRVLQNIVAVGKKPMPALAWGEPSVVLTPSVAVKGLRVERIAKGLY